MPFFKNEHVKETVIKNQSNLLWLLRFCLAIFRKSRPKSVIFGTGCVKFGNTCLNCLPFRLKINILKYFDMISCRRGKISRIVYFKPMRYIHAANLLYYTYIFMALFFSILRSNLITKPRKTPMRMVWITSHKKTSDRSLRKIPLTQCLKKEKSVTNLQHQRNQKRGSFFSTYIFIRGK